MSRGTRSDDGYHDLITVPLLFFFFFLREKHPVKTIERHSLKH